MRHVLPRGFGQKAPQRPLRMVMVVVIVIVIVIVMVVVMVVVVRTSV